ncbi:MAG: methyl-accepting chemotaxis protein [Deltaproteobacteria bacterium]|nr:methyl-accepting chemotaxis protein [Deltaproteobacteria bacterium]
MSALPIYRRKYLIKPGFQIKHAITIFINIVIFSIILGFIIFYPLYGDLYSASSLDEQARISAIVLYLHKRFWLGLLIVAILAGVNAIFSTHRVVGPVYRFEKTLEAIIGGDYSCRIRIRKRDEFREIEALLNRLAETL